jgi:hypothetical protein
MLNVWSDLRVIQRYVLEREAEPHRRNGMRRFVRADDDLLGFGEIHGPEMQAIQ